MYAIIRRLEGKRDKVVAWEIGATWPSHARGDAQFPSREIIYAAHLGRRFTSTCDMVVSKLPPARRTCLLGGGCGGGGGGLRASSRWGLGEGDVEADQARSSLARIILPAASKDEKRVRLIWKVCC